MELNSFNKFGHFEKCCYDVSLCQVSLQKVVLSLGKWSKKQWVDINLNIFNKAC